MPLHDKFLAASYALTQVPLADTAHCLYFVTVLFCIISVLDGVYRRRTRKRRRRKRRKKRLRKVRLTRLQRRRPPLQLKKRLQLHLTRPKNPRRKSATSSRFSTSHRSKSSKRFVMASQSHTTHRPIARGGRGPTSNQKGLEKITTVLVV